MMIKEHTRTKNMIERMKMLCVMCYALCSASYVLFVIYVMQRFSLNVIEE